VGWDKGGRYYTRSRKVNGRVVREHVGNDDAARGAAELAADRRAQRREERAWLEALDAALTALCARADLLARAALVAAGFHQHKGEWRKRRGQTNPTT
jgi:hypothetical protein